VFGDDDLDDVEGDKLIHSDIYHENLSDDCYDPSSMEDDEHIFRRITSDL
jgi:hypothetical protein